MTEPRFAKVHQVNENGSLAFIIPKEFRDELDIRKGDLLILFLEKGKLYVKPVPKAPELSEELAQELSISN